MELTKKELKQFSKNELIEIILILQKNVKGIEERVARFEKSSQTSSKPPSQDQNQPKRNQSLREKSDRKPGGQKGHPGSTRIWVEEPDKIESCLPEPQCKGCGQVLDRSHSRILERRQEVEIPEIKPIVTEYQRIEIKCSCGHRSCGEFPKHINASIQIGSMMKSFLIYLNVKQLIPYQRLTELTQDLFNFTLCKRTIENTLEEASQKGKWLYQCIMKKIKRGKWVGGDETGCKVNGKKWWEWVWQNEEASYYAIEKSRGYAVVKKHFGEDYEGSFCHDCWAPHNNTVAKSGHQQCLPHIQRDLKFLIENYHSRWAYDLNQFLLAAQKAQAKIWMPDFNEDLRRNIMGQYQDKLTEFLVKNAEQKDVLRLQKRIIKHQQSIFHFLSDPDIPFHNNGSERAIRMFKIKQKISGGFRSQKGAERHSILLSIIETAKKQKMNALSAIQSLLNKSFVFQGG